MSFFGDVSNRVQPLHGVLVYFSEKTAFSGDSLPGWDAILQVWTCVQCWAVFEHIPSRGPWDRPVCRVLCPFCKQDKHRKEAIRACRDLLRELTYSRSLEIWQDVLLEGVADGLALGGSLSEIFCGPIEGMRTLYSHLQKKRAEQCSTLAPLAG